MHGGKVTEEGQRRLDAMVRTTDGFQIANSISNYAVPENSSAQAGRHPEFSRRQPDSRPPTPRSREARGGMGDRRAESGNLAGRISRALKHMRALWQNSYGLVEVG